ncbi:MAG: hypothetical protein ACKO0Z_04585 [Betaproteobacteria bacterium]
MTEVLSLRDRANAFASNEVDSMVADIDAAVTLRDNTADNGGLSWSNSRKLIEANKVSLARFLLSLNVTPSAVICDKVVQSAMFNAKALKKVVELARFVVTGNKKIESVLQCFIICSLRWSSFNNNEAISNRFNKSFLSGVNFADIVKDAELAAALAEYQHKFMSGGKDTQSSQARRVLEVLGLGTIDNTENRYRGGVQINSDHSFFELFSDAYLK